MIIEFLVTKQNRRQPGAVRVTIKVSSKKHKLDKTIWNGTQKLTITILEKQDQTNANMRWPNFVPYKKITKDIDFSTMKNSNEILPRYRDQLEKIKDIFLGDRKKAIAQMTQKIRGEPSQLQLYRICTLFCVHFTPEKILQHNS